ncbi:MAG: hypothetical protein K2J72_01900, partial [Oscillospiraceae bacterium]|nr:hypothetical protein [Oscillospiraceae bacterium]
MRVTNNITTRQFLTNNNRLLTRQIQSENRISTQRRFNRVSEDIINGNKAMTIRRQLRDLAIYNDNLGSAKAIFNAAETNLTAIAHDNYIPVEERLTAAANGTYSQEELDIFATELDEIADEMVKTLNSDFSERQLFGGASNQKTPFRIERVMIKDEAGQVVFPPDYNKYYNADGSIKQDVKLSDIPRNVTYNGIPLDFDVTNDMILPDGSVATAAGSYTVTVLDEATKKWKDGDADVRNISAEAVARAQEEKDNSVLYPGSKPVYIDIGLGIKYNDDLTVDPQTALDVAINGAATTGCGIDMSEVNKSKSVTTMLPDSQVQALKNGCPKNVNYTVHLTIDGVGIGGGLNLGSVIPPRKDGKEYSDEEITAAFNKELKEKYELASNKELPEGVRFVYKDSQLTFEAGEADAQCSDCAATDTCFYFPSGEVNQDRVPLNKDGTPDLSDVYSKNLMQLVLDAASALRKGDQARVNAIIDRANEANNHILNEITTLGIKYNTIEFYQSKNKDYDYNLKERQNLVEGTDMENEIIEYYAVKAAYDATLKIGTQVLPH